MTDDVKRAMLNRSARKPSRRSASVAERPHHIFDTATVDGMVVALRETCADDEQALYPKRTQLSFRLDDATANRLRVASAVHRIPMQQMWTLAADLLAASFDEMGTECS